MSSIKKNRGALLQGLIINMKGYLCYLLLYLLFNVIWRFGATVERRLASIGYRSWDDTVAIWSVLAIILNLIIMKRFAVRMFSNPILSLTAYCMLCFLLGCAWFWLSVIPGFVLFVMTGGIPT